MSISPQKKNASADSSEHSDFESLSIEERFTYIQKQWGTKALATSSFGLQSSVMLHLLANHAPEIPIVFIDTGYLFPETYQYAEELGSILNLQVLTYSPKLSAARQEALHGKLWEQGKKGQSLYSELNKIEPMDRALKELDCDVWLSGLRRSQSRTRRERPFIEEQNNTTKVYPILDWSQEHIDQYIAEHQLPRHPLYDSYLTLGDWHSTKSIKESGGDAESSRFGGARFECGLHEESEGDSYQI